MSPFGTRRASLQVWEQPRSSQRFHNSVQNLLYSLALVWHCHQRKDRSFFIRGRQLPLCSRCTGILIGPAFYPLYKSHRHWAISVSFIGVFLADAVTQFFGFRTSNNWLRLATGIGFSLGTFGLLFGATQWLWSTTL